MDLPSVAPLLREPREVTSGDLPDSHPDPLSTVAPLPKRSRSRALCFDLENRPLAYWYDGACTSEITAFGWKWAEEGFVHSLCLRSDGWFEDERGKRMKYRVAHELFGAELASADLAFGHNIRRHDLPMVQAWRLRLQLPTLPPLVTSDTCRDLPKLGGVSKSLENLAAMYQLALPKHRMTQPAWERANQLHDDGVAQARLRVESDVRLQESLRRKLIRENVLKKPREWRP